VVNQAYFVCVSIYLWANWIVVIQYFKHNNVERPSHIAKIQGLRYKPLSLLDYLRLSAQQVPDNARIVSIWYGPVLHLYEKSHG
jgi:hypothetical protein